MTLRPANDRLLAELEPFVVAVPEALVGFDLAPFGCTIASDARVDPLRAGSAPLLDLLIRLDSFTFGPEGMPMPRWLFLDGAGLPGGIAGLGLRVGRMSETARGMLRPPAGYTGVVPYAMYIAIPTFERGEWMGHNLASLGAVIPGEPRPGLGALTKALGLKIFRAARQVGVTQWRHKALRVHARLGPLELLSAWTPAHSDPASLTYRVRIDDAALRHLARDGSGVVSRPAAELFVDSDDEPAMRALQARIESGERFCVAGVPEPLGPERQRVPIARLPEA